MFKYLIIYNSSRLKMSRLRYYIYIFKLNVSLHWASADGRGCAVLSEKERIFAMSHIIFSGSEMLFLAFYHILRISVIMNI